MGLKGIRRRKIISKPKIYIAERLPKEVQKCITKFFKVTIHIAKDRVI